MSEKTIFKCDHCGKTWEPNEKASRPPGWIYINFGHVDYTVGDDSVYAGFHACSKECAGYTVMGHCAGWAPTLLKAPGALNKKTA